jgi:hypothetical protein
VARVIRLLWRLDYTASYVYLDKRGAALNALTNTVPNFWDTVADGTIHASYLGTSTKDNVFRFISLEPNSLNGEMQWSSGTDMKSVLQEGPFRSTNNVVREILKVCDIRVLARAGIRFFCVSKFADGNRNRERTFNQLDSGMRTLAASSLGSIEDIGIILEGKAQDGIGYRVTFGPFAEKNATMNLLQKPPNPDDLKALADYDLFFDVDLFETNFSFVEHSLFRWAETKLAKAINFIAKYSDEVGA